MIDERNKLVLAAERGELTVRDMEVGDLAHVLIIENNAQISPWGRLSFEEALSEDYFCRVIEAINPAGDSVSKSEMRIVAYHIGCKIVDEFHMLNVVTAPQYQGLGLGHMLMDDIVNISTNCNLDKLFLEVRASNKVAQSLYLKWQFSQIAIRKQYYRPNAQSGEREDALIFMRKC